MFRLVQFFSKPILQYPSLNDAIRKMNVQYKTIRSQLDRAPVVLESPMGVGRLHNPRPGPGGKAQGAGHMGVHTKTFGLPPEHGGFSEPDMYA